MKLYLRNQKQAELFQFFKKNNTHKEKMKMQLEATIKTSKLYSKKGNKILFYCYQQATKKRKESFAGGAE